MSQEHITFSDPRWNDTNKPKIIGYRDIPAGEQHKNKELLQAHLKKIGILKD